MAKTQCNGLDQHQKAFIKLVHDNARRHHRHEVFRDFCELAALSISNSVDRAQFQAREARYLDIASRYQREELDRFAQMLAHLVVDVAKETAKNPAVCPGNSELCCKK